MLRNAKSVLKKKKAQNVLYYWDDQSNFIFVKTIDIP